MIARIFGTPTCEFPGGEDNFPIMKDGISRRAAFGSFMAGVVPFLPEGRKGNPDPAGNVASDIFQLRAAALANDIMIYDGVVFKWTPGNFTAEAMDAPDDFVESDHKPLLVGAWKRQDAAKVRDAARSSELASPTGFTLVKHKRGEAGTFARTAAQMDRAGMFDNAVHVLHWISPDYDEAIRDWTIADSIDGTPALQKAALVAKNLQGGTVRLPFGLLPMKTTLDISGYPIALIGDPYAPMQAGSAGPACTLRWFGVARPMITVNTTNCSFEGFAMQNYGSATDAFDLVHSQHLYFNRLSFLPRKDFTRFSRSIFNLQNASMGYSMWKRQWFGSAAPKFMRIVNGTGGGTPMEICDRCVFETNAEMGPATVIWVDGEDFDSVLIHGNTFNQQENAELCIFDNRTNPAPVAGTGFSFYDNEIDIVSNNIANRPFRMVNIPNIAFYDNSVQGGAVGHIGELTNSRVVRFEGNYAMALSDTFWKVDATSRVDVGINYFVKGNTGGYVNNGAAQGLIVPPKVGNQVFLMLEAAVEPTFLIDLTNDRPRLVVIASEGDSTRGIKFPGQYFNLIIRNTASPLKNLACNRIEQWRMNGAIPVPNVGKQIALRFVWDGEKANEISRTSEIAV